MLLIFPKQEGDEVIVVFKVLNLVYQMELDYVLVHFRALYEVFQDFLPIGEGFFRSFRVKVFSY